MNSRTSALRLPASSGSNARRRPAGPSARVGRRGAIRCGCALGLLTGCGISMGGQAPGTPPEELMGVTAVVSRASKDYIREKLPDGSFQPEFYAFGEGGNWGGDLKDASIDALHFADVAKVVAQPLAERKYLPARDPAKTRLIIMVYWGTTTVPKPTEEDPLYQSYYQDLAEYRILMEERSPEADMVLQAGLHMLEMANRQRDLLDFKNAGMLGYDTTDLVGTDYGTYIRHTALGVAQRDVVDEIEENRYFVVLMAYDFQLLWKEKKHKLLWETRFSVNERHNQFDRALPVMARYASRYFGEDSGGLLRTRVPEGRVEVKEPTLIEFLTGTNK